MTAPRQNDGFGAYFLLCVEVSFVGVCFASLAFVCALGFSEPAHGASLAQQVLILPMAALLLVVIGLCLGAALLPVGVICGWPVWIALRHGSLRRRVLATVAVWTMSMTAGSYAVLVMWGYPDAVWIPFVVALGGSLSMLVAPRLARMIHRPDPEYTPV